MTGISESLGANYILAKKQMDVVNLRQKALSANIANSQTPHYKRQDVDKNFESHLASLLEQGAVGEFEDAQAVLKTDLTGSTNASGNNVELDRELLLMNENNLRHQFLLKVAEDTFKTTRSAITGNPF
ncbi:MAG: flagellar basal body rod protein FlgB [bacterium]